MEELARQMGMDASFAHFAATGLEPCSKTIKVWEQDENQVWVDVMRTGTDMKPWTGEYLSEAIFADLDRDF